MSRNTPARHVRFYGGRSDKCFEPGDCHFKSAVQEDTTASLRVEIAIVTFGADVKQVQDFVTIGRFDPPTLTAGGATPMGEAIDHAIKLLARQKKVYSDSGIRCYAPWIFLITDGVPDENSLWQQASESIKDGENRKEFLFFAVGVERANMNILQQIAHPNRPPLLLNGLDFKSLFLWLSASMVRVSGSKVGETGVELPPVGWAKTPF